MNRFPKVLGSCLALAAFASLGFAVDEVKPATPSPESNRRERVEQAAAKPDQMVNRIDSLVGGLSEEQKGKIHAIYAQLASMPKEERRANMSDAQKSVRALLTAEQQKKFDLAMSHRRGSARSFGGSQKPSS